MRSAALPASVFHHCVLTIATLSTVGCTPPIPFFVAETADVLRRGDVSVTVAGGAGGTAAPCCGGGGVRMRVGVGARQEVGADATYVAEKLDDSASGPIEP